MYKLVLIDFDHILITEDEEIKRKDLILLDELRRKKIKVGLMTTRCLNQLLYYNQDFCFSDYLIIARYSYLYDMKKRKKISQKPLLMSMIKKLISVCINKASIYLIDEQCWNLINEDVEEHRKYDCILRKDYVKYLKEEKPSIYKIELYFKKNKILEETLEEINHLKLDINIVKEKKLLEITSGSATIENVVKKLSIKEKIKEEEILILTTDKKINTKNHKFAISKKSLEETLKKKR